MKVFEWIENKYSDYPLEVQKKAAVLLAINAIIGVLAFLLMIVYFVIGKEMSRIVSLIVIIFIFIISEYFLVKRRYQLSSNIHLFSLLTVLFILRIVTVTGELDFLNSVILYIILIFDASLIGIMVYQVWLISVSSVVLTIGIFLLSVFQYKSMTISDNIATISFGMVMLIIGASIASFLFILMKKLIVLANEETKKSDEKLVVIQKTIESLKQSLDVGRRLIEASESLQDKSNNSTELISDMNDSLTELDNNVRMSNGAVSIISNESRDIEKKIHDQGSFFEEATASIMEMNANIQSIAEISNRKKESLKNLEKRSNEALSIMNHSKQEISRLSDISNTMFDVIKIINNISAQTNLLSMNAAIEAAHAGEYGAGFSVVAEEIRNLSETSGSNTKIITENLKSIFAVIGEVQKSNEKADESFSEIVTEIGSYQNALEEILNGLKEIRTGSEEVMKASQELINISEDNSQTQTAISQQLGSIAEESNKISEFTTNTKNMVAYLDDVFTEFISVASDIHKIGLENEDKIRSIEESLL